MIKDNLDIIIPILNEAGNIEEMCKRVDTSMKSAGIGYRIIFVVDKSTDGSEDLALKMASKFPVIVHNKQGKGGKAFSILEGMQHVKSEYVVMIDGDLQYPPEAIPEMFALKEKYGIVVASRKKRETSKIRTFGSKINSFVFGKFLLGLKTDTQSGLKLFKREIINYLDLQNVGQWSLDAPLLYIALELGYQIGEIDIDFEERKSGQSKVNFLSVGKAIAWDSIKLRLKSKSVHHLPPTKAKSMLGAGMAFKKHRFITHTTLPSTKSAITTFTGWQKFSLLGVLGLVLLGFYLNGFLTITIFIGVLSAIYFVDVLFTLFLVLKSLHFPPEINFGADQLKNINESTLPMYTILCPLYKEASVLSQFVKNIETLDYPKKKLDVILLLEEGDQETISAAEALYKPDYLRIVIVPNSQPKTKPKACNYGLSLALGKYLVVYDAEDQPESDQLKKAVLGFQNLPDNVYCLQAKLNYYNPHHNLLTRFFTAEYSLWFDLVLPAFQSINTAIPLGGTSNHFRKDDLLKLGGWDAFNVTEDCDLGMRLFKEGYKTAVIDSITLEEANSDFGNWIRQRSRWIKGYVQTYLVHTRNPIETVKQLGWHSLIFQLVIGARTTFMLINPILWLLTISYFTLYRFVGPTIESFYPAPVFYVAVFALAIGNFVYLYNYMIGCAKRGHWTLIKFVFLIPLYWLMVSIAAIKAFIQLIWKPHFWEKTNHGLHMAKANKPESVSFVDLTPPAQVQQASQKNYIPNFLSKWSMLISAGALVGAAFIANFINFLGSTFLARSSSISFEQLGVISLIGSFLALSDIPIGSFGRTVTYRVAFLIGEYQRSAKKVWAFYLKRSIIFALIGVIVWNLLSPWLVNFFNASSILPLLIFAPVWVLSVLTNVNGGYLTGAQRFGLLAFITVMEAASKLLFTYLFVTMGMANIVYLSLPLSLFVSMALSFLFIVRFAPKEELENKKEIELFPVKFFSTSMILKVSSVLFLTMDLLLAQHYLSPKAAGEYALLSTIGKIVYLFGTQFTQFITPLVSRLEGANVDSEKTFLKLLSLTLLTSLVGFIGIGVLAPFTVPLLMGAKTLVILPYILRYSIIMVFLILGGAIASYHQIRNRYLFVGASLLLGIGQIGGIILYHQNIEAIINAMLVTSLAYLATMVALHIFYDLISSSARNLRDFSGLFEKIDIASPPSEDKLKILVFNWRDTKHVWAGGAEIYIHEIAKRWVKDGHTVTLFCGNDGKSSRYETIDGVNIIRRGGFNFVYVWAFLYYVLKLRGKFDVVVDCENGIPFFTSLYVRVKKYLVIYHVHQEVFRQSLSWPKYALATFLENTLMPLFYRDIPVVTISPSSKSEILQHQLTRTEPQVVYSGIDTTLFKPGKKSDQPMVLSLGRLQGYKSIHVFIKAAKKVLEKIPNAEFIIAGDGPERFALIKLVNDLGLAQKIKFLGRVTEQEKIELYQKAWVFVNPSLMEGWGISSIEANACGTPTVVSNVSGLRDSVHNPHSGLLVPYGDVDSFASHIELLLTNNSMRKRMSRDSIVWAKQFEWDKSAKLFIEILKS